MATYVGGKKIGRNDPCHCGSGQKFKRCHGRVDAPRPVPAPASAFGPKLEPVSEEMRRRIERQRRFQEAAEHQRQQQQGYGRPIISTVVNNNRVVAVGQELHSSSEWKTFHDFLFYYIKKVLGGEGWGNEELKKPFDERHPLIQWYDHLCRYQREFIKEQGKPASAPMTGAVRAYLGLAYYLYLIAHNNTDISTRLIHRLKNPDTFRGAYYEIFVAAIFINAGFQLEFENEEERSTTHCEFVAIAPRTGKRFSVECKSRQHEGAGGSADPSRANPTLRVGRQLARALKKKANYSRVVFIDVNVPDQIEKDAEKADWMDHAVANIRKLGNLKLDGMPADPAYVFVTNHPYTYNLEGTVWRSGILSQGFKIPEFGDGAAFASLVAAIEAREKHQEMHDLLKSMAKDLPIPATFEGENPDLAFDKDVVPRLLIGHRYAVPDEDGEKVSGELIEAVVLEDKAEAMGVYRLDSGKTVMARNPLTEAELRAYKRHPDTFFGVFKVAKREAKNELDLFDFFYENYRNMAKEQILASMRNHADIAQLAELPQEKLAKIYCERMVYSLPRPGERKG